MKKIWLSLLILSQIQNASALTKAAESLIYYETQANAAAARSQKPVLMPHYQIPLEFVGANFSDKLSEKIKNSLIISVKGKKYVRWILNPEDTKWFAEVENYFKEKHNLTLKKRYYYTGYQTASRSYIVENPQHTVQFSVKSSTNVTGGLWANKKQPVGEAVDSRLNAEFLAEMQKVLKFKNIIIMDEPAILEIPAIDQAVVIRDLADINSATSDKIYLPGFSVLHEKVGAEIALKNGSNDPSKFWNEHYIKATGKALGEFAARTGMQFDSPHSQNFLVEFDKSMKPTGRIVFRDLADLYISKDFMTALNSNSTDYFKKFSQKDNLLNVVAAGFGPLHGNKFPSWISQYDYMSWNADFFIEFEKEFARVSGLDLTSFKIENGQMNGLYFSNQYKVKQNAQTDFFWENMKTAKSPRGIFNCAYLF